MFHFNYKICECIYHAHQNICLHYIYPVMPVLLYLHIPTEKLHSPLCFYILYPLESTFQKKNAPYMCIWRPVDFTNTDISSPIYFPMKILSLFDWIKSQWVYRSHFLYPFICWLPCQFSCLDIMKFYNYMSIALLDTDSIVIKYSLSD